MTSRIIFEASPRTPSLSNCDIVATNCAQATAALLGTLLTQPCNARAIGLREAACDLPELDSEPWASGPVGGSLTPDFGLWALDFWSLCSSNAFHSLSAPLPPMPRSNRAKRLNESSSLGLFASFRYAVTSLTWACSKNRMPLVILKGM